MCTYSTNGIVYLFAVFRSYIDPGTVLKLMKMRAKVVPFGIKLYKILFFPFHHFMGKF